MPIGIMQVSSVDGKKLVRLIIAALQTRVPGVRRRAVAVYSRTLTLRLIHAF